MVYMISMDELLTTKELADLLRLNEKKVYQLIKEGVIPHVRIAGKWLFPKEHIMRWIDENVQREQDILIVGSDDILLARLLALYSRDKFPQSLTFYSPVGSLRGIQALSQRKGQACCIHILDLDTGEYNLPFLSRHLSSQQYIVVNLWYRRQGLILKKGNPMGIKGLEDALKKGLRFINRNEGSGTRLLLEYLLGEKGLEGKEIVGFADEVDTHLEVALKVFFGEADVGMGIEYVAHLFPLDFISIQEERFDLVIPKELWSTKVIKGFIAYIDPVQIRRLSHTLPGYNLKDTGKVIFEG
ncbi:MAG: helix-turn-helix domain-containing protein [Deltaproteobacteria bacterium]|nr:helix-turn-helix domain-containing protein [Deltaproteobacteria bacterium]